MNINRKIAITVMVLTGFIFAVSFGTLYVQTHISEGTACSCTLPIPVLIPTFSSLGVFVGSLVYYLMFARIKESEKKLSEDAKVMLDMLPNDEKEMILRLVGSNGEISQSRLSGIFGKVRTFRTVESLKKRGIVVKEKYGKTNMVKLESRFRNILY
ncbi:MAG: hypothetical protein COY38_02615 [Candidatus Aenigmarchaeota archaeon CG_4_10_14_0_8_um_filter_37_24]|nr:hypothetical protein [Candidatus Aenigmarchaeota archaeon]PIV67973.1 MAG: hypothetical protein COS07_05705 [Candidatus Aenigmarchaeota archaeon CG01_land_8_20_14_3_00_37_9]PIW41036.1 MAG: hypothetical protein COW21_03950 [Candidatus Aenigmarchaeota archaeon CG15_BIG_FIL_POST_REV_8_21_14_020_37_27]PIX51190.1 MAG: hypothetical protein COZ52_00140 [Candidatus Aenigmarchaeota archaeon CG_4_8_14_3_um_filter_37_24]PIY34884.1 MAG: hypothetical protein COZ04_05415 [Candidatus Aenigmarchaeota archaeo